MGKEVQTPILDPKLLTNTVRYSFVVCLLSSSALTTSASLFLLVFQILFSYVCYQILEPPLMNCWQVTKITAFVGGSPDGRCNYSKHQFGLYSESEDEGTAAAEDIEVVESSIAWEREVCTSFLICV